MSGEELEPPEHGQRDEDRPLRGDHRHQPLPAELPLERARIGQQPTAQPERSRSSCLHWGGARNTLLWLTQCQVSAVRA